jgi:predicted adenylyl cyclase CyaB
MSADGSERELKIPVDDHDAVRTRLLHLGARRLRPDALERNEIFDWPGDEQRSLRAQRKLLRLREGGDAPTLTFKGPPRFEAGVKIREEHEVAVIDASRTRLLLAGLGLAPVRRYEKRRETWELEGAEVVLDATPIGNFVEVEAPTEAHALEVARALELDPASAEGRSYLELYDAYRERHPEAPPDMIFVEVDGHREPTVAPGAKRNSGATSGAPKGSGATSGAPKKNTEGR